MAAGDFSASAWGDVYVDMANLFGGERHDPTINRPIPSIQAMATRQQARFSETDVLMDGGNCRGVTAVYMSSCDDTVVDCTTEGTPIATCDISGVQAESVGVQLADNLCTTVEFAVSAEHCDNRFTMDDMRAFQFARNIAKIEKQININAVKFLEGNAKDVALANAQGGVPAGGTLGSPVDYTAAEWSDPKIVADILIMSQLEGLFSPYFISGSLLYKDYVTALQSNPTCCDAAAQMLTTGMVDIVFDILTVDQQTTPAKSLFSIDPASYIFWGSHQYQNDTPQAWNDKDGRYTWRVKSPRLTFADGATQQPVYYDVTRVVSCTVSGGKTYPVENYRLTFRGGMHPAPDICLNGVGIIHTSEDGA